MKSLNTIYIYQNGNNFDIPKIAEPKRFNNLKEKGHYYFDKIWKDLKLMTREKCYEWLANKLNINNAHFSYMNKDTCIKAIYFCQQLLNDNRRLDLDFGVTPSTPFYFYE